MVTIEMTLEDLIYFLKHIKRNTHRAYKDIADVLDEYWRDEVFTSHNDVKTIRTKKELANLIKSGGEPPAGPPYNPDYLRLKQKFNEPYPHRFLEYNFWNGANIRATWSGVEMSIDALESSKDIAGHFPDGSVNYLQFHERRRSVLKLAWLRNWQRIIEAIRDRFTVEAMQGGKT